MKHIHYALAVLNRLITVLAVVPAVAAVVVFALAYQFSFHDMTRPRGPQKPLSEIRREVDLMMTYKLFLSKNATQPVLDIPFKWMLTWLVAPLLRNHPYYRFEDSLGNLVVEREIRDAV